MDIVVTTRVEYVNGATGAVTTEVGQSVSAASVRPDDLEAETRRILDVSYGHLYRAAVAAIRA